MSDPIIPNRLSGGISDNWCFLQSIPVLLIDYGRAVFQSIPQSLVLMCHCLMLQVRWSLCLFVGWFWESCCQIHDGVARWLLCQWWVSLLGLMPCGIAISDVAILPYAAPSSRGKPSLDFSSWLVPVKFKNLPSPEKSVPCG